MRTVEKYTRVLLVEDDPVQAGRILQVLSSAGGPDFGFRWVWTVSEAIDCCTPDQTDIILTDLSLCGDGDLTGLRRLAERAGELPVVALGEADDGDLLQQAIHAGAQDYLLKEELDGGTLIRSLRYAIERKRLDVQHMRLERQMRDAQKLESLGVLAGGIAHDFNNLLVGILGHADLALQSSGELPERLVQSISGIRKAAVRASELTNQMLAYSGRGQFVIEPLGINDLVEEMSQLLSASKWKKASLRYQFEDDLPAIEADPTQVRQVVMNLITNACEAVGDEHGEVHISTSLVDGALPICGRVTVGELLPDRRYVCLRIADTGCGMAPETLAKVFDPFFTTKRRGRGLGMAAVLGIVRSHHGAIAVDSEPCVGTTFRIFLPASDLAAPPSREPDAAEFPEPWRAEGTVIVVDDEEDVRDVLTCMLEGWGFDVVVARDGEEGIERFAEHRDRVVAVLLDLTMPRKDGQETFAELHALAPEVPVFLCSGYSEGEAIKRFDADGLAGFIQKPFDCATICAKLREVLGAQADNLISAA